MLFILMGGFNTVQSFRMSHYKIAYALNSGNRGAPSGPAAPVDGSYFGNRYYGPRYFGQRYFG